MSAAAPNHPYDPVGLDAPFSEGRDESDRFEMGANWNELGQSPYAESPYAESPYAESMATDGFGGAGTEERLAWLDVEAERDQAQYGEDLASSGEALPEHEYEDHYEHEEQQHGWRPEAEGAREAETETEMEFLDDEERDAFEAGEASDAYAASEDRFEPEAETPSAPAVPLTVQQRAWILALDRSAIERVADTTLRERFLQQDWSDIEFPGNVPKGQTATAAIKQHWALARSLFNAMAGVVPERRVPASIRFRDRATVKVPGQASQRLYPEARDAFVRMHAAAKADGVDLTILSSWRSRARQAAASANQPNPNAVARKASAHMYGLAIDVRMGVPGLPIKEINTRVDRATAAKAGTSAKMGNLVRMYRSPVYKWLSLRAREFGWFPYRNEPWHWEYNPPGLKARFEAGTRDEQEHEAIAESPAAWNERNDESPYTSAETDPAHEAESEYENDTSPNLRTFTANALPVKLAVYVTQAARRAGSVEMLVYAHGLDLCKPVLKNRPASFVTGAPFKLGELVEASGRPIVLVVPFLDWERLAANRMAFGRKWHRLAQPDIFNRVASEALDVARGIIATGTTPTLRRLILAGHSRAYGFFDALANAHGAPQMRAGALSRPLHIWALDTTYSAPIADWRSWLRSREDMVATIVFRHGTYRTKGSTVPRELTTGLRGRDFTRLAASSAGRMTVMPIAAAKVSHCAIPSAYLPRLLAALPPLPTSGEEEHADEMFAETEDEAGLATEAEAQGAWENQTGGAAAYEHEQEHQNEREEENEEEQSEEEDLAETSGRFDAFNDARDTEWSNESAEELAGSFDESAQPLSFALEQEDEGGLSGSGLTPSEQKAVEITSLFETGKRGGFYGLSGNFDGQGLSFGLVNWTMGTGSLQPLLRDFAKAHPARWTQVFGADASRFLQVIARKDRAAQKQQHRFAIEEMNTQSVNARRKRVWTVRQPWVGYFRRLSEDAAFQQIQVRYVRDLLVAADGYCRLFGLTSERALCFMFDAVSSHGKWWLKKKFDGAEKRRVLVEQALKALAARHGAGRIPEADILLAIADALATTSAQRWAGKVRQRKRWFVTGEHPRKRELAPLLPRANVPYSTSATRKESAEASAQEWLAEAEVPASWVPNELISPRFAGEKLLSACFHDKGRLGEGASGSAVTKVQQALIDLGYDLGTTGADGRYGPTTAAAVRAFKRKEALGFEQYGDVGPGTMRRLDQIFAGEPHTGLRGSDREALVGDIGGGFVPILLAPPSALRIPPDEGDCPPGPVSLAEYEEGGDPCLLAPAPPGAISDFERDLRRNPGRILSVVIDPDNPDEIIGYRVRTDASVLQIVDREGNFVAGNEKSLDTPMLDPIDFIPSPGGIAKGAAVIGKVGLKAVGKLVAKQVPAKSLWHISAAALPRLRGISAEMLRRASRAAAKEIPNIARRITEEGLNHSFDRHAAQWFGGAVQRATHFEPWRRLVQRTVASSNVVPWSLRGARTVAHLALIDGKHFVVQFFVESGELASAFVLSQRQVAQMLLLLAKLK